MKTVMLLFLLVAGTAQAQTIWRCGPDGRSYSDKPCSDGSALSHGDDRRSEAEVRAGHEMLKRDQALARELHQQNREAEHDALARGSGLAGIGAPPPAPVKPKAKTKPKKSSTEAPEIWKAVALGTR